MSCKGDMQKKEVCCDLKLTDATIESNETDNMVVRQQRSRKLVTYLLVIPFLILTIRHIEHQYVTKKADHILMGRFQELELQEIDNSIIQSLLLNAKAEDNQLMVITNTSDILRPFSRSLSQKETEVLMDLLYMLFGLCNKSRNSYFCLMFGRTLLGSYHHHDLIPWQDGAEVLIDKRFRTKLCQLLTTKSDYVLYEGSLGYKLYHRKLSVSIPEQDFGFPHVDIIFFKHNETHLWNESNKTMMFLKSIILPSHIRPLAQLQVPGPRSSLSVLRQLYGAGEHCQALTFSRRSWTWLPSTQSIECCQLRDYYNFVRRDPEVVGIRESLMQRQYVVQSVIVNEPKDELARKYSLDVKHINEEQREQLNKP